MYEIQDYNTLRGIKVPSGLVKPAPPSQLLSVYLWFLQRGHPPLQLLTHTRSEQACRMGWKSNAQIVRHVVGTRHVYHVLHIILCISHAHITARQQHYDKALGPQPKFHKGPSGFSGAISSGRGPTGLRARLRNRVVWKIGVTWSRKRGFKMAATELGYLLTQLSFWLSLWHDISISWHGGKES